MFLFPILIAALIALAEAKQNIVGGEHADISNFKYLVLIRHQTKFCGGGLISKGAVITAAHCTSSLEPSQYDIRQGKTTQAEMNDPTNIRLIATSVHIHEGFNKDVDKVATDLAVIRVERNHSMTTFLKLDTGGLAPEGTLVKLAGWGFEKTGGKLSPALNSLEYHIAPPTLCQSYLSLDPVTHVCADSGAEGKSGCNGDSGSPLVTSTGVIVGLVSYGDASCSTKVLAFTRISTFAKWIKGITVLRKN